MNPIQEKCAKLVKDVIFHLLTVPDDWRYTRDSDWSIGSAENLEEFIEQNIQHIVNRFQDPEYIENFKVSEEDEDGHYEAELEIFSILRGMFPTIDCMHADNTDELRERFVPVLRKIYEDASP